jgi:hypothetical protein
VPLCGTIPKTILPYGHPLTQPRVGFSWDTTGRGKTILRGGFGVYTQRDPINAGFGAILGPPNLLEATICCNLQTWSKSTASSPSAQGSFTYGQSNAVYDPRDTHTPAIYQYNLTVSETLPAHFNAELAYVGSESRHQQIEQNIDNIPYGALWTPGTHIVPVSLQGNEGTVAPYAPFKQIVQIEHEGNSNYNGLQATLRRQASRSVDFMASYTYSKAMGDSDQFETLLPDPYSTAGSYHVLSFDRTHLFSLGAQWYVPKLAIGPLGDHRVHASDIEWMDVLWDCEGGERWSNCDQRVRDLLSERCPCVLPPSGVRRTRGSGRMPGRRRSCRVALHRHRTESTRPTRAIPAGPMEASVHVSSTRTASRFRRLDRKGRSILRI